MHCGLPNSIETGSVNTNGCHYGPGGSAEGRSIYMNTCVPLDQGNLGEDANSDVEEDYVNVPNMRNGSAAIENGYEEDCIYQNYNWDGFLVYFDWML